MLTESQGDPYGLPFVLELRPGNDFSYESGKAKLANLRLGEQDGTRVSFVLPGNIESGLHHADDFDDGDVSRQQTRLMRLAGWVSVESRVTVSSLSCIICTMLNVHMRSAVLEQYSCISNVGELLDSCLVTRLSTTCFAYAR